MSYKLYTDKANKFQCTIQVEGTSLNNSQARIILETNNDMSYLFKGKLYENGVCEFDLPKLKNILTEGEKGLLRLEIIADDVHFEPWNSQFNVVADKKINVVVQEQITSEKPKIVMNEISLTKIEEEINEEKKVVEPIKLEKKVVEQVKTEKTVVESTNTQPKRTIKLTKSQIEMLQKNRLVR
jgi:hypothetical protein